MKTKILKNVPYTLVCLWRITLKFVYPYMRDCPETRFLFVIFLVPFASIAEIALRAFG